MKKTTRLISLISCITILISTIAISVFSASSATVANIELIGSYNYDFAYDVLDLVNEERESLGLEPLSMDIELLDASMQRAAETAITFSHTRPDHTSCFTACNWERAVGENIAGGYYTPEEAMDAWRESKGHYANIISTKFTCIGVGVYESYEGIIYWSQMFDASNSYDDPMYTGTDKVTPSISTDPTLLDLSSELSDNIIDGKFGETSSELRILHTDSVFPVNVDLSPTCMNFKSSDTSVADIDKNGVITAYSNGSAKITASLKGDSSTSTSTTITVKNMIASVKLSPVAVIGDSDGDGYLSVTDATHIQKYLSKMVPEEKFNALAADVDHDGGITILDSTLIQKHCANIIKLK